MTDTTPPPFPLVEAAWVADPLNRVVVLDATVDLPSPRHDGDYRVGSGHAGWLAGHIPGARHADLVSDLSIPHPVCSFTHPSPERLARALERLGVGDGMTVVTYDRADGFWAARLWWMLRGIGVDARVLDGGWRAWQAGGYPVATGPQEPPMAATLTPGNRSTDSRSTGIRSWSALWADRDQVRAALRDGSATVVCALPAAGYWGRVPTRYARRGHIPGSLNIPARDLMDEAGRLKPPPALSAVIDARLSAAERDRPLVLYCGGGISAAYLALGLAVLGRDDVAIYDGSLQEWAATPDLPLVSDTGA